MSLDRALAFLFRPEIEGEHSAPRPGDPHDTWYGLARTWNQDMDWPPTREQAAQRYRERYWDPIQGDRLPWPVSLVVFDAAVQHGVRGNRNRPGDLGAIEFLQQALGVQADGIIGPATRQALAQRDPGNVADEVIARRLVYYPTLPSWSVNRLGWMRRLVALHREAIRV